MGGGKEGEGGRRIRGHELEEYDTYDEEVGEEEKSEKRATWAI